MPDFVSRSRVGEPNDEADFPMRYYKVHSHRFTFESDTTRRWVESWLQGRVLNSFAGETRLNHSGEVVRNDANPDRDAELHVDAAELDQHLETSSFDTIIHDPPWSSRQGLKSYEGFQLGEVGQTMKSHNKLLKAGGRIISLGFTMTTMPSKYAYQRLEVANFETVGRGDDYFGVVEQNMNQQLDSF